MSQAEPNSHQGHPYPPSYSSPSLLAGTQAQGMQYPSYPDSIDGRRRQPPQSQQQQPGQGPHPQPMQFYQPYPIPPHPDPNAPIRYPLPPHPEGRLMSGGRHKKEIKRRTKTGCLTCRKRRIKCDEGHPSCRNCQKSKRECLGYDPIFKPQPGPPAIQPASQAYSPSMSHTPPTSYNAPPAQGYPPALYGAFVPEDDAHTLASPETVDPSSEGSADGSNDRNSTQQAGTNRSTRKGKRIKIEDVLCINGISPPPPAPPSSLNEELKAEIKKIYSMAYAPGMDKFLEIRWFSERGLNQLMGNSLLCDQFAMLTHRFATNPQDPAYAVQIQVTISLEVMVVWSMLGMCRKAAAIKNETGNANEEDVKEGVLDGAKRLEIFQALITGESMSPESAPKMPDTKPNGGLQGQLKSREYEFWHLVHSFLTRRDDSEESSAAIDDILSTCRSLLERRENRDVIYSIMVTRHFGPKIPGFPDKMKQPQTNDEDNPEAKVAVAKSLLESEAEGRGTNQVVQRLCGAAVRSWSVTR